MNLHRSASFDQATIMASRKGHSAAASVGACHNFTIEWLSLLSTGVGALPTERMAALQSRAGAANAILQKVYVERFLEAQAGGTEIERADRQMIALRGMKEEQLLVDVQAFNLAQLTNPIATPRHSALIYTFWFTDTTGTQSGHTIGFYRALRASRGQLVAASTDVLAFDPNFGEYCIPSAQFGTWFTQLMALYGTFNSHMLKAIAKA